MEEIQTVIQRKVEFQCADESYENAVCGTSPYQGSIAWSQKRHFTTEWLLQVIKSPNRAWWKKNAVIVFWKEVGLILRQTKIFCNFWLFRSKKFPMLRIWLKVLILKVLLPMRNWLDSLVDEISLLFWKNLTLIIQTDCTKIHISGTSAYPIPVPWKETQILTFDWLLTSENLCIGTLVA